MKNPIVIKIGGSNLKTVEDIKRISTLIKKYNQPVVIVVSAYFGVTNFIIDMLKKAENGEDVSNMVHNTIYLMKEQSLNIAITDDKLREETLSSIASTLDRLRKFFIGIKLTGDVTPSISDLVESYGERLSAIALNGTLRDAGIDSEVKTPEELQLITDGEFGNGSINFELSRDGVKSAINSSKVTVIPGFYGISTDGRVNLLGRGGTDYSAASIAKIIGASSLDIWKDVNGFMSADPKMCSNAVGIDKLAYVEAAELAYFGAKILHPRTVEPLIDSSIPIKLFNIYGELNIDKPETVISNSDSVQDGVIKSITQSYEFGFLKLKGAGVGVKPGILSKVTTALHHANINISSVITSQISINILLAKKDLEKAHKVVSEVKLPAVSELISVEEVAMIAAVGVGLIENYGVASRIFGAMAKEGINVIMSCSGASPVVSYYIVKEDDIDKGIKAIHKEFFE